MPLKRLTLFSLLLISLLITTTIKASATTETAEQALQHSAACNFFSLLSLSHMVWTQTTRTHY